MKRRILSIMTALALVLGLCPAWAFAAEGDDPPAGGEALVVDVGTLPAETLNLVIYNNMVSLYTDRYTYTDLKGEPIENPECGVPFSSLVLTGTGAVVISLYSSTQVTLRNLNITALDMNPALVASGEGTAELTLEGNVSLSTSASSAIGLNMGHSVKMTGSGNLTVKQMGAGSDVDLISVDLNCSLTIDTTGDVTLDAGSGSLFDNINGSNVNPISISARNITLKDATGKTSFAGVTLAPSGTMEVNGHTPVAKVTKDGLSASYVTLEDAWEAAQAASSATITLLDNVTLAVTEVGLSGLSVEAGQDITFEGGAFTLTGAPGGFLLYVNGGKLTVSSGTIAATAPTKDGENYSYPAVIAGGGEFVMTDGTLKGAEGSSGIGLGITDGTVQLSGGSFTGGKSAVKYIGSDWSDGGITDLLLRFLLNYTNEAEPHYAYYQNGKPFAPTSITLPAGTFTVGECRHPGVEIKKNEDGSHGMSCPYCGYGYTHSTVYTATASGGVITVGEGCDDESCGYKAPLGSLTVGIPELAYGELDKKITWDTSKLTNWTAVAFQIDSFTEIPVTVKGLEANYSPQTLDVLTNNALLKAGEHTLTVTIGISVSGDESGIVPTVSCEIPFTVDPAVLIPDSVTATTREYEKGNRAVVLSTATKDEPDIAVTVEFPAGTTGTVSGENAGIYDEVTLAQDVKDSSGNYIIPAGTYPVRGRIADETPSEDGVTIYKAAYGGVKSVETSAKFGTTGTYDFTNLLQGIDGAILGKASIDSDAIFDGEPTVSGNILTYKLKEDAEVDSTGKINVLMGSTNYITEWLYVWVTVTDKDVPALTVSPITATYNGEAVPDSAIQGTAKVGDTAVPGTWAFAEGQALTDVADSGAKTVKFTPTDGTNYMAVESTVMVTINKATPTGAPTYTAISAGGKTLADAGLTTEGGTFSTEGTVAWVLPETTEVTANTQYEWIFTPTDAANYNTVTGKLTLWVRSTGGGGGGGVSKPGQPVSTGVSTEGSTPTTETTAVPTASVSGGKATATVDTSTGSEIVKQAVANNSEMVVIAPRITGDVSKTEVSIPASTVGQIGSQTSASLTVSTPVADVIIPHGGLGSLGSAGGTVTVAAEKTGNTVELTVTAGGRAVESVPGGVTLTVPAEDAAAGTVAVLVHEDGTREVVRKSVAGDGSITIPLDGSAKLEIVDNSKQFDDVPATGWVVEAAAFVSSHELFQGTAPGKFSPDAPMSRGMLAVVLHNLENNPAQTLTGAFADVSSGQWYAEGVAWAEAQGIIGGYGNGQFGPNDSVTREQLAVMLWRYAGSPAATDQELRFADADRASDWAVEALRWAAEKGILNGTDGGMLDPDGQATRAEAAQMLKNFVERQ